MGRHCIQTSFFAGIRYKSWQNLKQRIETNIQSISTNAGAVLRDKCAKTQLTHQSEKGPERFAEEREATGLTALRAGEHTSTVVAIPPLPPISLAFFLLFNRRVL